MPPPTVTGWTRLEPYSRSDELRDGLRAEVHDPLWMLTRQWQVGEFQGEDVGSPVQVRLRMECTPLTRYQPGVLAPGATVSGQRLTGEPLEALVEKESIRREGALQPRLAAEAGLHLCRLPGAAPHRADLVKHFGLRAPDEATLRLLDEDTRGFLRVMAGRVPDGGLLYSVVRAVRDATTLNALAEPYKSRVVTAVQTWNTWQATLPEPAKSQLNTAVDTWLQWYQGLFSEPARAGGASWVPERMEYEATVSAPTPQGEVMLTAPEYVEGSLDWYSFNHRQGGSLGAVRADLSSPEVSREVITRTAIPTPVGFPGMPSSRWWEFEDARLDWGGVTGGPQELARLLMLEFALVYGDDWFMLPVDMPVGVLGRTNWLVVTDTFGERTLVHSARAVDRASLPAGQTQLPFDLFGLSPDRRAVTTSLAAAPDVFFLPPALGASLQGEQLEEVFFLRDGMANMAWAVEHVVESPLGRPVNRAELLHAARRRQQQAAAPTAPPDNQLALPYVLATEVPPNWVPLLPVRIPGSEPAIRFQRGGTPQGRILEAERNVVTSPLFVDDEEVPGAGARVTRAFQYARWLDGKTYLWVGRRKGAGRGEAESGLRFDVLEPARRSSP